ncbi:MAG: DNA/RNA nuclease SfsA [Treponema sp.]|jgi:sugar fermentation stimulation protein A|nr:DNA/RNA nuclease SfsA [Treponema sp.]
MQTVKMFNADREAIFISRPNRFLIIAADGKERLRCHCPNPGRLTELMFPGTNLILERRNAGKGKAKTDWTAAGLRCRDGVVPLFASRANLAAERLILPRIISGIREIHREFSFGASRFDFLCIGSNGRRHLVEVKACSLVEYGTAMFPDAPSIRALKHLKELAVLSRQGYICHILFVIMHGKPERFVPNLHTDPEFASALFRLGKTALDEKWPERCLPVHTALLECGADGMAALALEEIPVDLNHGALAESNGGNYLLILEMPEDTEIIAGSLGMIRLRKGWYIYAGSARKNLRQRISRHLRKLKKRKHWHIDYVTPHAGRIQALPILSYRNLECSLAADMENLGGRPMPGFGCSDCRCGSHLFGFGEDPLKNRLFTDLLFRYRHIESLLSSPI